MIRILSECDPLYDEPNLSFLNEVTTSVLNSQKITKAEITFVFASDELLAELKSKYFNKMRNWSRVKYILVYPEQRKMQKYLNNLMRKRSQD